MLEKLGKKGIQLPSTDVGEVTFNANNDPRGVNAELPGLQFARPYVRRVTTSGETIRSKVESYRYFMEEKTAQIHTTVRWGRRDRPNEIERQIKAIRQQEAKSNRDAVALSVRRNES